MLEAFGEQEERAHTCTALCSSVLLLAALDTSLCLILKRNSAPGFCVPEKAWCMLHSVSHPASDKSPVLEGGVVSPPPPGKGEHSSLHIKGCLEGKYLGILSCIL